uniref:Uncharacterized protein n=1 Tax=Strigamia maritima TaxID=126957 RepID=T1IPA7_STRMM
MMKMISCLLVLSFGLLALAEEECFDKETIMKEYKDHEKQCQELAKDKKDKMEIVGCILGRYECTKDGKVDYDKFKTMALSKIDKSDNKKKVIDTGIDGCKSKHSNLDGHDFWHCVGELFKKECMG